MHDVMCKVSFTMSTNCVCIINSRIQFVCVVVLGDEMMRSGTHHTLAACHNSQRKCVF
jgi:hypothetical protein